MFHYKFISTDIFIKKLFHQIDKIFDGVSSLHQEIQFTLN